MEITKYIGLFLLKNNFCYVHGLGNMELLKVKAMHDGTALQGPTYVVIVTPGGSIDDNLANFIATNEQISISKAANALREFSTQTRKDLAAGKEVVIPNIGKFVEQAGKVKFITDENFKFTPAGIPTIKNSKQLEEQNLKLSHKPSYPPPSNANSVNWSMVVLAIVLVIILGAGGYAIYYYNYRTVPVNIPIIDASISKDTAHAQAMAEPDTLSPKIDTVNAPPVITDTNAKTTVKIIIGDYFTRERAERRVKNLTLNGNQVEMVQKDSTNFIVITTVKCRLADTARVKDSLRVLFGYKGVSLYK